MPNQKLLEVIQHLSASERKELRLFTSSVYHNRKYNRGKVIELLDHILALPREEMIQLDDKKQLNGYFFPEKEYTDKGKNPIDSLASDLFSIVRRFLLQEEQDKRLVKIQESLVLAKFYRQHGLEQRFWQSIKMIRKQLSRVLVKGEAYFKLQVQLENEVASFESLFNTYTSDSNLINANIALDQQYVAAKLEKASTLIYQQNMGGVEVGNTLVLCDAILEMFDYYREVQSPMGELYFLAIKLLKSPLDEELLAAFVQKAAAYKQEIATTHFRNLMAFYRYFVGCQYQLTVSGQALSKKLFRLYQDHLDKGYFHAYDEACLLPGSLKLMVNFAIKVGEIDWASALLNRYPAKRIIGTRYPQEAHSLCTAEVLFAQEKFGEAENHIVYRNYENVNYSIFADVLLIKIYYETENDLFESRVSALGQKVRRSKLKKKGKQQYLNFLRLVKQLMKYRYTQPTKAVGKLTILIQELLPIVEREWLSSKLK